MSDKTADSEDETEEVDPEEEPTFGSTMIANSKPPEEEVDPLVNEEEVESEES